MTIAEKWQLMMSSFADIKAAILEMGGSVGGGYSEYAKGVRSIYFTDAYTPQYTYPKHSAFIGGTINSQLAFCAQVKEEIRQAIIDGDVECDETVPLSEYGDKIRQIAVLKIVTTEIEAIYDTPITAQLQARGGQPPYKWSYTNSLRPPGCTITEDGVLSGTPTTGAAARYLYMKVTDAEGRTAKGRITFRIKAKTLHFQNVSGSLFRYTGEPQQLNIVCTDLPDAEFKVVYGSNGAESVTDCGQYLAQVVLTGETAKGGKYYTDYTAVIQISGWTLNISAEKSQVYTYDGQPHAFEYTTTVVQDGTPPDASTVAMYKPYSNNDDTWDTDETEYTSEPPVEVGKYRIFVKATGRYTSVICPSNRNRWFGVLEIKEADND